MRQLPKQHRWVIKRNLQQAENNVEHALNNIATAGHEFEGVHPEYYQAFSMIAINLEKIKGSIAELGDLI